MLHLVDTFELVSTAWLLKIQIYLLLVAAVLVLHWLNLLLHSLLRVDAVLAWLRLLLQQKVTLSDSVLVLGCIELFVEPEGRVRLCHVIFTTDVLFKFGITAEIRICEGALIEALRVERTRLSISFNLVRDVEHVGVVKWIQIHVRLHANGLVLLQSGLEMLPLVDHSCLVARVERLIHEL